MPKDVLYGKTLRKSFARVDEIQDMPNLLEIQKSSYKWFLETGLHEVFRDVDSVTDYSGNLELSFIDYSMNEKPKYTEEECKARDATYAAPLKVRVRLRNKETEEIKEQEIFMGDFPIMTPGGTFVINGAERVIVSQIVRSPGVYYDKKTDKAYNSTYGTTVIPYHGAWLEYETDLNDIFNCRIDKNRKLPVTWFIKAMGAYKADNPNTWLSCIPDMTTGVVTNEQIKEVFDNDARIVATEEGSRALEVVRLRVDPLHDRYDAIRARALDWAARLKDRASLAEADSDSLKRTIGDAIASALNQKTSFKYNVIVVDDNSDDGSVEIIKSFQSDPKLIYIAQDTTWHGIGGNWNSALHHPKCGRFALQLDSDDVYADENVVQRFVDAFYAQNCAMVVGTYRLTDIDLNTIPPGVIDHREWTPENGRNNALRINGLGAPRGFYVPLLRELNFPPTKYGEDYAVGLRVSREYQIGRIYDVLYNCRRWDSNSDAALDVDKVNANNFYKDKIRTWELTARIALNQNK